MRFSLAAKPPQQRILALTIETRPLGRKCSQFPQLNGLVVVVVPAD
jgi:hypothetical protein